MQLGSLSCSLKQVLFMDNVWAQGIHPAFISLGY